MESKDDKTLLRICRVVDTEDDCGGDRIKVRLGAYDNDKTIEELPYCFPLLPKLFHVIPKKNEYVLVILTNMDSHTGNRFYLGPIISQDYFLDGQKDFYQATTLFKDVNGNGAQSLKNPAIEPKNEGTLIDKEDIAVRGRSDADIVFKDSEIRMRCGFKKTPKDNSVDGLEFNDEDLSYIQMKRSPRHDDELDRDYNTSVNVVADRINLLSHDSKTNFRMNDRKELITDEEMQKIMTQAHPLPYGDDLVKLLEEIRYILLTHTHPYPMLPPSPREEAETKLGNRNLADILSKSIRIN